MTYHVRLLQRPMGHYKDYTECSIVSIHCKKIDSKIVKEISLKMVMITGHPV